MRFTGRFSDLSVLASVAALAMLGAPRLQAQADTPQTAQTGQSQGEGRRGQFAGMTRMAGEVTAISGNTLTVKAEDGTSAQVVTTDNTRLMKDRNPVKISDIHPGDGLMAFGNLDASTKTLHAAMVMATDAATVKAMRENLGKTYIAGRVTAVDLDNAKMTVERSDHVAQTIGFDETTSFKRAVRGGGNRTPPGEGSGGGNGGSGMGGGGGMGMGMGAMAAGGNLERAFNNGESITLADIKIGDGVAGTGSLKNGVFVPTHLLDSPPRQRPGGENGAPGQPPPASSNQPVSPGPANP